MGSNTSRLEKIDLSNNMPTGTISEAIGRLGASVILLDLSKNHLTGPIPAEIGDLLRLRMLLDLSSNKLTGTIPATLTKLTDLQKLNVSRNKLSGSIPSGFIQKMLSLDTFDYSFNHILCQSSSGQGSHIDMIPPCNRTT